MSDSVDLCADNYTIRELLEILGIEKLVSANQIIECSAKLRARSMKAGNRGHAKFFSAAANKLLSDHNIIESLLSGSSEDIDDKEGFVGSRESKGVAAQKYDINITGKPKHILPAENVLKHEHYKTTNARAVINSLTMPNRKHNIKVPMSLDHAVQLPKKLLMPNAYTQVPFAQGGMNPTLTNVYHTWVNVDSQFRALHSSSRSSTSCTPLGAVPDPKLTQNGTPTDFIFTLDPPVTDVMSMSLASIEIPMSGYYIYSRSMGNTTFDVSFNWKPPGYYTGSRMLEEFLYIADRAKRVSKGNCGFGGRPCVHIPGKVADIYNTGTWHPTNDVSGSTVNPAGLGKYTCASIPSGNYQNSSDSDKISMPFYLTLALQNVVGPVPSSGEALLKSALTYYTIGLENNTDASELDKKIDDAIEIALANVTESLFVRVFGIGATSKLRVAMSGSVDWWQNEMLTLCVPTSTNRLGCQPVDASGGPIAPFTPPAPPLPPPYPPQRYPPTFPLPAGDPRTQTEFGNFIFIWNEIVCNWAHTDILTSFGAPGLPVTPPSITFEEFLKQQPGYENLALNGGWGAPPFKTPPLGPGPDGAQNFGRGPVAAGSRFDSRVLQGYWHNVDWKNTDRCGTLNPQQGSNCPLPWPPGYYPWEVAKDCCDGRSTGLYPGTSLTPVAGTGPVVGTAPEWYPRCAPWPPVDWCAASVSPNPPYNASHWVGVWDPEIAVGQVIVDQSISGQKPFGQGPLPQCCPPFVLNQVQMYVLYYIELVLIPEATTAFQEWWAKKHPPIPANSADPTTIAGQIQHNTRQWLWLGGNFNYPTNDRGDVSPSLRPPDPVKASNLRPGTLPWPFPFTFKWDMYTIDPAWPATPEYFWSFQTVSPGFLPQLPQLDLRWYKQGAKNGGNCGPPSCKEDSSLSTGSRSLPRRRINANLGWSLGFRSKESTTIIHPLTNTSGKTPFPPGFLNFAALNPGYRDASGGIIGAAPWRYVLLVSCLSGKDRELMRSWREYAFKQYFDIGGFALEKRWADFAGSCYDSVHRTFNACPPLPFLRPWQWDSMKEEPAPDRSTGIIRVTGTFGPSGFIPPDDWQPLAQAFIDGWPIAHGATLCGSESKLAPLVLPTSFYTVPPPSAKVSAVTLYHRGVSATAGTSKSTGGFVKAESTNLIAGCNMVWLGLEAGCIINLGGTNYITLSINDFQHNRYDGVMPGLPIPPSNENFKLPHYYRKYQASYPSCVNKATGELEQVPSQAGPNRVARACRAGSAANAANPIIDGSNNLTLAQKYTAEQIQNHNLQKSFDEKTVPLVSDVLIRLPVDRTQQAQGGLYTFTPTFETTSGGRGMGRIYYGPTTLKRLHVQLLDDWGKPMPLHCGNISFALILERLYQY